MKKNNKKNSQNLDNNKELSARLLAVQAYYEVLHNAKPVRLVIEECLERGLQLEDSDALAQPHGGLFKKIITSLDARLAEVDEILAAHIHKKEAPVSVIVADDAEGNDNDGDTEKDDAEGVAQDAEEMPDEEPAPPPPEKELEPLLKSILLCGVCELLEHQDIDAPLVINDYLNVTHAFYEQQQVNFVNGVLGKIASVVRD
ncbi:MAG: hypothetical protein COB36_05410 [Alphaproteobacteria bacterium]|nr:MAG: hypothetical protein COB36_05410 [Alphaproteobacteria bacterium]